MNDFEKLGVFYLGRLFDQESKKSTPELLLYDSKDLVTHAVCLGMTGSGKTGLCIDLLEEAAIDGIPSIIIDPKGDMPNLLLSFPDLKPEDFKPWVNEEDAQKKGLSLDDYAKDQADLWKKGLTSWDQDGNRIKRFKESAEFTVFTPGSNAGFPVSILSTFEAPPLEILTDNEALGDLVNTTVTSLLGLLSIDADPIQSQEHILLSTILTNSWKSSINLDLTTLIQQIQTPSFSKIGVLDLESFYPAKERFKLSLLLNNLLAAPGFSTWLEGEPLHIDSILYTKEGKPRVSIFSIAHLTEAERMFFVSLLLNQIVGWMRTQSGTTSLRAIVYMDEIFGYFPPVANPPSKTPLLTLLKQARAFGVGIVLVTQNPVDLDYKGLSNTGTWLIGRLQTERDQMRVLDGLEGASAVTGTKFDRNMLQQTMAGLGNRVFLMNNVHDDSPVVFESRWAMSYLRGPLTRNQIKLLCDPKKPIEKTIPSTAGNSLSPNQILPQGILSSQRPILPPDIEQFFAPVRGNQPIGQTLLYKPSLFGIGKVYFQDEKNNVDFTQEVVFETQIKEDPIPVNWDIATMNTIRMTDMEKEPVSGSQFFPLPVDASRIKNYETWGKDFISFLYRNQELILYYSPSQKIASKPNETESEFRVRLTQKAREERDLELEKLRDKYAPKIAALKEQIRKSMQAVDREKEQAKQQKIQTAISIGATILGAMTGRRTISQSTIGRASTTFKNAGRSMKEAEDIKRANDTVEAMNARLAQMESDFQADTQLITEKMNVQTEILEKKAIRPSKTDISVQLVALIWMPYWLNPQGILTPTF